MTLIPNQSQFKWASISITKTKAGFAVLPVFLFSIHHPRLLAHVLNKKKKKKKHFKDYTSCSEVACSSTSRHIVCMKMINRLVPVNPTTETVFIKKLNFYLFVVYCWITSWRYFLFKSGIFIFKINILFEIVSLLPAKSLQEVVKLLL